MRKLIVFNHISLDGYFTDAQGDMGFARNPAPDAEWDAFVEGNAGGGGTLVFGRVTYELMASYWPTATAVEQMPVVARRMNTATKVVFSRTLQQVFWQNTRLVKADLTGEIRKMKNEPGEDMLIFGSGSLVAQLAQAGLIDLIPVHPGPAGARRRQNDVRRPPGPAAAHAQTGPKVRKWECSASL